MNAMTRLTLASAMAALVVACSSQGTIADLESESIEETAALDFKNLDHDDVRGEYEQLIDLVDDEYLKEQIERRIAGVNMAQGDDKISKPGTAPEAGYYRRAIASYVDILEKYPNSPDNAEVLYQLAKAYDMEGQPKNARKMLERLVDRHPYYERISEAYFRLGDIYFSSDLYNKAEKAYRKVTLKDGGNLILNSHYMLAWSLYKQGSYDKALDHYAYVLNDLMDAIEGGRKLNNVERPLVDDTLHSMSLALVNLGGAAAIEDIDRLDGKKHVSKVYSRLAEFYLEKSRYNDSAMTYRSYIERFEFDSRNPEFHTKLIAAYDKGAFPKMVLKEKAEYITAYGPESEFLKRYPAQKEAIYKNVRGYYVKLAQFHHSQAQEAQKTFAKSKESHLKELADKSFDKATQYYGNFVAVFPQDKKVPEMLYQKADAHFEYGEFDQAAKDYYQVAYRHKGYKKSSEAAYASIIAYRKHIDGLELAEADVKTLDKWRAGSVDAMLRFAQVYPNDKRAVAVLSNAAQYLFELKAYDRAIEVANGLLENKKRSGRDIQREAYGILAHSYFQLGQYQLAQNNYYAKRQLLKPQQAEYAEVSKQLAAAIYKRAEAMQKGDAENDVKPDLNAAVKTYLSIKKLAPNTDIRVVAQYDAVSILLQQEKWKSAISELKQLIKSYPKHELAVQFPRKLAFAYEQDSQNLKAAVAYLDLYKNDKDAEIRREAKFIAAGLYRKENQLDKAILHYRDYAHEFEKPFDERMEARYQLADLYEKTDDRRRHLYWLRRVIQGDKTAGSERTDRSRYLGAWASTKYGDYFAWEFNRRSLRDPLQETLARKNQYLKDATTRYEQATEYGILEFVTQASYKMAELYNGFSQELNSAPLPSSLSAEEKQGYRNILAQQAAPFRELAKGLYENNITLSWEGHFNQWIAKSFEAMKEVDPQRFAKSEAVAEYGDEIR
ncbi:tetratricopeptide repeat protein [Bermanella marisrubri]|uniref:Uncharacterized protein n=1 Tax=Bermanella marisrubri TaxID=207949 RepID=Q1MYP8_9GAMM|nr:tetratricopeptide repeat protein [Bermanella marisrubri]EAT11068.1 hypothetical protein RED65_07514 [Oceanobacter sp. RED65] [Bermanella marisrubri]QIZ83427.1 tetratricopeptide repeat protein [Bermanella marisrubri]